MAKKTKVDFKKVVERSLITAGTGAVAHVVAEAIDLQKPEYIDYGLMAVGVVLPEVVKGDAVETASNALLAVGGYRTAERHNLAGKLGFNATPKTAGIPPIIGSGWRPAREVYASSPDEKKNSTVE